MFKEFYENYFVNEFGIIQNKSGKVLKTNVNERGYVQFTLGKNKKHKTINFLVHRLVAIHFIPNPDNKPQVNHKDGNKLRNEIENLEWSTSSENCMHAINSGLYKSIRVITDEEATDIILNYNKGIFDPYEISSKLQCKFSSVMNLIISDATKKHLKHLFNNEVSENISEINVKKGFLTIDQKSEIVSEYIPGKQGNYKYICEKYNIKKSRLYQIVSEINKSYDKTIVLDRYIKAEDKTEEIYKMCWDYKISKSTVYSLVKQTA